LHVSDTVVIGVVVASVVVIDIIVAIGLISTAAVLSFGRRRLPSAHDNSLVIVFFLVFLLVILV
jgi:hypothetical protein